MRTQRYLPKIQNGRVAKRQTRSKNPVTTKSFSAPKSSARSRSTRVSNRTGAHPSREVRGSRVIWLMLLTGVILTTGFVFALRSQLNAHKLGQAEEDLRVKLDQYTSQQKFLMLDQQRALNTSESERAGRQSGLDQLKLDQPSVLREASVQKIVHQVPPVRQPQTGQNDRSSDNRQNGDHSIRQPIKPAQSVKTAKPLKAVKSNAAKANVVKANVVKSNAVKSKKQSNNQSKNQRQASRSQHRR